MVCDGDMLLRVIPPTCGVVTMSRVSLRIVCAVRVEIVEQVDVLIIVSSQHL